MMAAMQALASPLSGFLGDSFDRVYIVVAGTVLWGAMTAAIGASRTLPEARCTERPLLTRSHPLFGMHLLASQHTFLYMQLWCDCQHALPRSLAPCVHVERGCTPYFAIC